MTTTEWQPIQAVDNTFAVVRVLKERNGAGITEVADELGLSKSTVHDHLKTLERQHLVVRHGDAYHLGMQWLDIGGFVRKRQRLYETAKPEADELAEITGELVAVTTHEYGQCVYLYQSEGPKAITIGSHVGVRLPLHCTANGKAILAHLPDSQVDRILDDVGLEANTENTITNRAALREELDRVRERGVALEDEERIEGTRGIGAPICRKDSGEVIGAIALCGPTTRLQGERFESELPELVRQVARVIEVNVTFSD